MTQKPGNQDDHATPTKRTPLLDFLKAIFYVIVTFLSVFTVITFAVWLLMDRQDPKVMSSISEHATAYVNDSYPGNDFIIGEPSYSMMASVDNAYSIKVQSTSSPDTYFYLRYHVDGYMTKDSYHEDVTNGKNVRTRLQQEFSTRVGTALAELGEIQYFQASLMEVDPDTGMRMVDEKLIIDGIYDIAEFGAKYGAIIIKMKVDPEYVSFEETVNALRKMDELLQNADQKYQTLDLELYTSDYSAGNSSFNLYDVTEEVLHNENSEELLWQLWEKQEQKRKELREKWANGS